jgi:hypothetical protein
MSSPRAALKKAADALSANPLDGAHRVRCSVANTLGRTTVGADQERVVREVGEALSRETTVAGREALTGALGRLASRELAADPRARPGTPRGTKPR